MTCFMNTKPSTKLLTFSSFILILIFSFIVIGLFHNHTEGGGLVGLYLLIIAIIGLSLLNLIQVMKATARTISTDEYLKKSFGQADQDIQEAETSSEDEGEDDEDQQLDPATYEKKLLPQSNKKQDLQRFSESVLSHIAKEFDIVQGLFYVRKKESDGFTISGKFAYFGEEEPKDFQMGTALTGQTAKNQKVLRLAKIPENYITILSGLGSSSPNSLMFVPLVHQGKTVGLIELAAFRNFDRSTERLFDQLSEKIGKRLAELL